MRNASDSSLLQAIARVNRSRKGKNAGYVVDYNGITAYLIQALEIFSGDLRPDDILKNLNEELPKLEMNHTKLVDFFKPMKIDRNYERDKFIRVIDSSTHRVLSAANTKTINAIHVTHRLPV